MADIPPPPDPPPPPNPDEIEQFPPGVKTETRYAIVQDGVVVGFSYNVIPRFVPSAPPEQAVVIVQSDVAQVGWIDDGTGQLVPPIPSSNPDPAARMAEEMRAHYLRTVAQYGKK